MKAEIVSLYQLNKLIQEVIKNSINEIFWLKAEIAQIKENYSGHCYLELIEKDSFSDKIIAQAKATIWANTFRILKPYFETTTNRKLSEGLKILICAKVEFHEIYGLSLNITDIDPSFTVGELALKKAETIRHLKEEGIFDMNHELELPIVIQRIAIISSETAAGYSDLLTHLSENPFHYYFSLKLFPAFMQGEKAEDSIIDALDQVNKNIEKFDAVVIIRGGGSQLDLSCFDSYLLGLHVAQFPLPVLTGIGHEQDDSVVDMVAHSKLKTPTAVADFIISQMNDFEIKLDECKSRTIELSQNIIDVQKNILQKALLMMPVHLKERINNEKKIVDSFTYEISKNLNNIFQRHFHQFELKSQMSAFVLKQFFYKQNFRMKNKLTQLKNSITKVLGSLGSKLLLYENIVQLSNPENILKKGFSITLFQNQPVTDSSVLSEKDILKTRFHKGSVLSEIKGVMKKN